MRNKRQPRRPRALRGHRRRKKETDTKLAAMAERGFRQVRKKYAQECRRVLGAEVITWRWSYNCGKYWFVREEDFRAFEVIRSCRFEA